VIGRAAKGTLVLDLRCLEDDGTFLEQLPQLRMLPRQADPA